MRALLSFLLLVAPGQLCVAVAAQEQPTPVSSPNLATNQNLHNACDHDRHGYWRRSSRRTPEPFGCGKQIGR